MDVVWLSANEFGYEMLKEVMKLKCVNVKAVVTLAEDATTVMYDSVSREKWYSFGVPVYYIKKTNDSADLFKKFLPSWLVVCGWRQIVSKEVLDLFSRNVIGFHPALLPVGRGPAPIINAILHGHDKSGVSMFIMKEGIDDGDIIGQEWFEIDHVDDSVTVYDKVLRSGRVLVSKYFPLISSDNYAAVVQDESKVYVFPKVSLDSNRLDLENDDIEMMYRKIRALAKYNGAYIEKNGKRLIIRKAEML